MVDHDQKRVEPIGRREIGDKVTGELLERPSGGRANGGKGGNGWVRVGLVLLASRTPFNVFTYERREAGPPKLGGNKLAGFKIARVAGGFMIVAAGKDGVSERGVRGNVNASLVGENALSILPVG